MRNLQHPSPPSRGGDSGCRSVSGLFCGLKIAVHKLRRVVIRRHAPILDPPRNRVKQCILASSKIFLLAGGDAFAQQEIFLMVNFLPADLRAANLLPVDFLPLNNSRGELVFLR